MQEGQPPCQVIIHFNCNEAQGTVGGLRPMQATHQCSPPRVDPLTRVTSAMEPSSP